MPDVSIISKFADDTKLANTAATVEERTALQDNLNGLCKWADIWGMEYNIAKCKVMHVGNQNINHDYFMNNSKLEAVDYEKDVGVTVSKDLKPSIHCANAAMAANRMLGIISRAFHYRDKCVFLRLYMWDATLNIVHQYGLPGASMTRTCWKMFRKGPLE